MAEIVLHNGMIVLVDEGDLPLLSKASWTATHCNRTKWYAARSLKGPDGSWYTSYMHREIIVPGPGKVADHINGNGLDNRRCNLRIATPSQNGASRLHHGNPISGYRGVYPHRRKFVARISIDQRFVTVGSFDAPEDAARAYDEAAIRVFGEFARLNFPAGGEQAHADAMGETA